MYLYHYSAEKYDILLNKRQQGIEPTEEDLQIMKYRKSAGPYVDHISFMVEKMPMEQIGKLYKDKHNFWKDGNVLYEHVIHVDDIDLYAWRAAESEIHNFIVDVLWMDIKLYKRLFFSIETAAVSAVGKTGDTLDELKKYIEKYPKGKLLDDYIKLTKRKDIETYLRQYAPRVEHLMVYTNSPTNVTRINEVIVGTNKSKELKW